MLAIEELHERLLEEGIPHEYEHKTDKAPISMDFHYLIYPSREKYVGDFIQHYHTDPYGNYMFGYSYGSDQNLMEGMGFDICCEKDGDDVKGYIGVEEAYQMIKRAMQEG